MENEMGTMILNADGSPHTCGEPYEVAADSGHECFADRDICVGVTSVPTAAAALLRAFGANGASFAHEKAADATSEAYTNWWLDVAERAEWLVRNLTDQHEPILSPLERLSLEMAAQERFFTGQAAMDGIGEVSGAYSRGFRDAMRHLQKMVDGMKTPTVRER